MEGRTYTVGGPSVGDLPRRFATALDPEHRYSRDGVDVLFVEQYEFWRTNSNMQATVIVDQTGGRTARVEVLVGGGATGLLKWTMGSENKVLESICEDVERAFDELGLDVSAIENPILESG